MSFRPVDLLAARNTAGNLDGHDVFTVSRQRKTVSGNRSTPVREGTRGTHQWCPFSDGTEV